jgi:hypothetical protein
MLILFRVFLTIAAAVALVVFYFFFVGLADGSVSSFNIGLWLAILAIIVAVMGGGWALSVKGHRGVASAVLAILAIPGLFYGLFVLLILITQPRWN